MNFTFLPSLEHIVLVKIATTLWNQSDIRSLIVKCGFKDLPIDDIREDSIILKDIEEKVKEKVQLLNKPSSLKEKIICIIKPIGLQICSWMECHKNSYNIAVNLPDEFSWTPHGTIDRKKTAEALMTDETIDVTERYKLACIYCLKNYVGALWEKMPENHRASFYSEDAPRKVAQHELVVLWTYDIKGEMAKLENMIRMYNFKHVLLNMYTETCTLEQYHFKCAFIYRNRVAAEYFWNKLSLEEREDSLRFIVKNWRCEPFGLTDSSDYFDMLHFLFNRVNKDQQIAFLEKYQWGVLLCFLQWPWQNLLMDVTNHVVLKGYDYYIFLDIIVSKVTAGYADYEYQRLFGELWQKSTEDHKKGILNIMQWDEILLLSLFRNKDMKNISIILKDASVLEKAAMCDNIGSRIFLNLYCKNMLDEIYFFINEFILSQEMMIKLKGKCMKEFSVQDDRLEKFLDDLIKKFYLKSTEERH